MAANKPKRDDPDVNALLNRFAAEEDAFLQREFLAPAVQGGIVRVRIGGVVCRIRITPRDFEGWGIFQPTSHIQARLVRRASLAERRRYLELFPAIGQIICRRGRNSWFGSAASFGDARVRLEGLAPLQLAEDVQLFDAVRTRYDGAAFWFDELDMRHDPAASAYLRTALNDQILPDALKRPGLSAEERAAYELCYWELHEPPESEVADDRPQANPPHRRRSRRRTDEESLATDPIRQRLRDNLTHAGAQLISYLERGDSFRVSYSVDGTTYTSSVAKEDLSVQVAGICLNGQDQRFDLGSLVGVLREGRAGHEIYRVGDASGMDEEEYWRVHPRRNQ